MTTRLVSIFIIFILLSCEDNTTNAVDIIDAPMIISVNPESNKVTVTWTVIDKATSYSLFYDTQPIISNSSNRIDGITDTIFTIDNLINETTYYFSIKSNDTNKESDLSEVASAIPSIWKTFSLLDYYDDYIYISCITVDSGNNIWAGAYRWGLFKYDGLEWTQYNSNLPSNNIECIALDSLNNLWIGTDEGLTYFDGNTWTTYNVTNSLLSENDIQSIEIDSKGTLWIGTHLEGLCTFDGTNWTTINLPVTSGKWYAANSIPAITFSGDSSTLIGTQQGGLYFGSDSTWQIYDSSNSDLKTYWIQSLFNDNDTAIWIGTQKAGLYKYQQNNFTNYNTSNSDIISDCISAIYRDSKNTLWVGCYAGAGINKISANEWTVHTIDNTSIGLGNVYDIAEDKESNLWLATSRGVVRLQQ